MNSHLKKISNNINKWQTNRYKANYLTISLLYFAIAIIVKLRYTYLRPYDNYDNIIYLVYNLLMKHFADLIACSEKNKIHNKTNCEFKTKLQYLK